jgi:hypothetical protein
MEAKEAVGIAKEYFKELFSHGGSLEEIWFDDRDQVWCVTIGIKQELQPQPSIFGMPKENYPKLVTNYKVVRVRDKDGKPISIKNRDGERAA